MKTKNKRVEDDAQYLFVPENIYPASTSVKNEKALITPPIFNVKPPSPIVVERTTEYVPSPAYSSHISWVFDNDRPEMNGIRFSSINNNNK